MRQQDEAPGFDLLFSLLGIAVMAVVLCVGAIIYTLSYVGVFIIACCHNGVSSTVRSICVKPTHRVVKGSGYVR